MTTLSNIIGSTEIETHISVMGNESTPPVNSVEDAFAIAVTIIDSTDFYLDFVSTYDDSSLITTYSDISAEFATTLDTTDEGFPVSGLAIISETQVFEGLDAYTVVGFAHISIAENDEFVMYGSIDGAASLLGDLFTVYDAGTPSSIYEDSVDGGQYSTPSYAYSIDGGTP